MLKASTALVLCFGVAFCYGDDPFQQIFFLETVKSGNQNLSETLIKSGANVNAVGKDGSTPLHVAAEYGKGRSLLIKGYILSSDD